MLQSWDQTGHGRSSVVSLSSKKPVRGSPKANSARELIEKKGAGSKEEKASTLPRKGAIYAKKESGGNVVGRKMSTLPRNRDDFSREPTGDSFVSQDTETCDTADNSGGCQIAQWHSLESVEDIAADTSMDYVEFSSQTLPRSYKAEVIRSEWAELMERSSAALGGAEHGDMFHTLPRTQAAVRRVLTVQEKLEADAEAAAPPPAELYVNLLEDEDGAAAESDADTASMSTGTVSLRPTPHLTPHHSFSSADREAASKPIDVAKMLDPFEQLEREFGWEGGVTIRPPSAFCSLADIQEDSDEKSGEAAASEQGDSEAAAAVSSLDDSGVCDVSEAGHSEEAPVTPGTGAR